MFRYRVHVLKTTFQHDYKIPEKTSFPLFPPTSFLYFSHFFFFLLSLPAAWFLANAARYGTHTVFLWPLALMKNFGCVILSCFILENQGYWQQASSMLIWYVCIIFWHNVHTGLENFEFYFLKQKPYLWVNVEIWLKKIAVITRLI